MNEKIFDIIIYNRSKEEFKEYWDKVIDSYCLTASEVFVETHRELIKDKLGRNTRWMNSVIGYIHIYKSGTDLITQRSIDVRQRKRLEGVPDIRYVPSTFTRTTVKRYMSSQEILQCFNSDLRAACEKQLKGRYIDWTSWDNVSKYIDWHKMFFTD